MEEKQTGGPARVLTLAGMCDGAALELFQGALDEVLRNIADPNTDPKAKRAIRLDVIFAANEDRNVGDVELRCSAKLAGLRGVRTIVYMGRHEGALVAVEQPRQQDLFPQPGGQILTMQPGGKDVIS